MKKEFKQPKQEKPIETGKKFDVEKLKDKSFKKQETFIEQLKVPGGAKNIFNAERIANFKEAFRREYKKVSCIDEGTPDGFHLAGLGILFQADSEEERLEKVSDIIIKSGKGNNKLEVHPGCGAAKKACERDNPGKEPAEKEVAQKARDWSEKLAKAIKSKGIEMTVEHITAEKMRRPARYHDAVVAYYDGTGKFNPGVLENIPQGFGISRGVVEKAAGEEIAKKNSCQELDIACSLALGDHGLGERFNKDKPFTIVVVGKDETQLEKLKKEVADYFQNNPNFKAGRIMIDGFVAPPES